MAERRELTGRALQKIRFNIWKQTPHCKHCNKLTAYPYGFEIDHIIPLDQGGDDSQDNRQLLCLDCHAVKTLAERKERGGMF